MPETRTDRLIRLHTERLAILEEQIAVAGLRADPALSIEAESIRCTIAQLRIARAVKQMPPSPALQPDPWYDRIVIDWSEIWRRGRAFLLAFGVLLLFLLVFSFVR